MSKTQAQETRAPGATVEDLVGLCTRARNACRDAGIKTRADLATRTDSDLLKYHRIGRKTLAELRTWSGTADPRERLRQEEICRRYVRYLEKRGYTVTESNDSMRVSE